MALPMFCGCGCPTTLEAINIPGDGALPGLAGQNAYTTLTATLTIPAIGANVTATVPNAYFLAFGQDVAIGSSTIGVAHFKVAANVSSTTSVILTFLGYPGDAAPAAVLPIGSVVSPAGPWGLPDPLAVYGASGTATDLAVATGLITIGAIPITLIITTPGKYLLSARARLDYWGCTFAATQLVTLKLRRTNNTAADVTNATAGFKTDVITLLDYTAGIVQLPTVLYTTAVATDSISLYGNIDVLPSAGAARIVQADFVAQRYA